MSGTIPLFAPVDVILMRPPDRSSTPAPRSVRTCCSVNAPVLRHRSLWLLQRNRTPLLMLIPPRTTMPRTTTQQGHSDKRVHRGNRLVSFFLYLTPRSRLFLSSGRQSTRSVYHNASITYLYMRVQNIYAVRDSLCTFLSQASSTFSRVIFQPASRLAIASGS